MKKDKKRRLQHLAQDPHSHSSSSSSDYHQSDEHGLNRTANTPQSRRNKKPKYLSPGAYKARPEPLARSLLNSLKTDHRVSSTFDTSQIPDVQKTARSRSSTSSGSLQDIPYRMPGVQKTQEHRSAGNIDGATPIAIPFGLQSYINDRSYSPKPRDRHSAARFQTFTAAIPDDDPQQGSENTTKSSSADEQQREKGDTTSSEDQSTSSEYETESDEESDADSTHTTGVVDASIDADGSLLITKKYEDKKKTQSSQPSQDIDSRAKQARIGRDLIEEAQNMGEVRKKTRDEKLRMEQAAKKAINHMKKSSKLIHSLLTPTDQTLLNNLHDLVPRFLLTSVQKTLENVEKDKNKHNHNKDDSKDNQSHDQIDKTTLTLTAARVMILLLSSRNLSDIDRNAATIELQTQLVRVARGKNR